jgi:hypothetical protein
VRRVILLQKFWRQSGQDRLLLLEATLWLAVAALATAGLPFRYVRHLAAIRTTRPELPRQMRFTEATRIRWAILACARRVPWRAMCFQQGLAAQIMLRRRGVPSRLYYGVAPNDQRGISAHVWVRDGDINIIGAEIASRFAPLAAFPPQTGFHNDSDMKASSCVEASIGGSEGRMPKGKKSVGSNE